MRERNTLTSQMSKEPARSPRPVSPESQQSLSLWHDEVIVGDCADRAGPAVGTGLVFR